MRPEYAAEYEQLERQHWWWLARRRIVQRVLRARFPPRPGPRPTLVDIGCGPGVMLASLRDTFDCVGLEPDPVLAEHARRHSAVPIHAGRLTPEQPLTQQRFDCVLLLDVVEHIEDDVAALRLAGSMLEPGGQMIVNVPALPWLWSVHDEVNQHKRRYLRAGLREVMEKAGLQIQSIRYWGMGLVPMAFAARRVAGRSVPLEDYRVSLPPAFANTLLRHLLFAEYRVAERLPFPLGLSLLAVAGPGAAGIALPASQIAHRQI